MGSNLSEVSPNDSKDKGKGSKFVYTSNEVKDKIFLYKKKIKLLSYFSKKHIRDKYNRLSMVMNAQSEKEVGGAANIFSDKNDFFDSDDEAYVNNYMKFIQKDMAEEEQTQKTGKLTINPMETLNDSSKASKPNSKNTEATKNHSYLIQKAFLKDTDMKELKVIKIRQKILSF